MQTIKLFSFILFFFLLIIGDTKYVQASTISISSRSFTISSGHYKTLYVNGSNRKVTWSTSNKAVATVSSYGRVTAKSPGNVTIYAYVSGKKLYSKVTVIKLNATSVTMETGKTKTLKVYGTSSKVTWTSSNKNFNAPLYCNDPIQPYKISVDSSIQNWLKAGFPKDKLVMGVPFYGFIYNAVAVDNYGLYQTYYGGASISYANIAKNYLSALEYIRYYHSDSRVPWLFNGSTFITYEDEQSMAEKARYIEANSLCGVMIWELSQDPNKVLLNSLYKELSQ